MAKAVAVARKPRAGVKHAPRSRKSVSHAPMASFGRVVGYRVVEWKPDHAVLEMRIRPHHRNRSGVVHGGVLMTLLDAACSYAGNYSPPGGPPSLSASISITTSFIGNVDRGVIRAVGRKTGGGKRIYFARGEVLDPKGSVIAEAESIFRYRSPEATDKALKHARRMGNRSTKR